MSSAEFLMLAQIVIGLVIGTVVGMLVFGMPRKYKKGGEE